MPLSDQVIRLAKGVNLASVVTLMPDGRPQAQYTWIDTDGEYLLVNTVPMRQRHKNLQRDPRITVLIPGEHPWDYAEIRGHVVETVGGQEALDHIDTLARKYLGTDTYPNPIGPEGRVILKIAADEVNARAGQDQRVPTNDGPGSPASERPSSSV
jgi:PPOX class probable F420-dependent enzyme